MKESSSKYIFPTLSELKVFEKYSGEINQTNDNDLKVGLWKKESEKHSYILNYIINDNGKSIIEWAACYNLDGTLESVCGQNMEDEGLNCADARDYYLLFGIDILKK